MIALRLLEFGGEKKTVGFIVSQDRFALRRHVVADSQVLRYRHPSHDLRHFSRLLFEAAESQGARTSGAIDAHVPPLHVLLEDGFRAADCRRHAMVSDKFAIINYYLLN